MLQGISQGYFDGQLNIMGQQTDPSGQYAQIGFSATMGGAPVMGMISVASDGQSGGRGFLMFDHASQFNQSGPVMMNAIQQTMMQGSY
jgi:hypothetical protein